LQSLDKVIGTISSQKKQKKTNQHITQSSKKPTGPQEYKKKKIKPLCYIILTHMLAAPITTHPKQDTHNKPAT